MCGCPAHRDLVVCTGCRCDHGNDRMAQWKRRALQAGAERDQLKAEVHAAMSEQHADEIERIIAERSALPEEERRRVEAADAPLLRIQLAVVAEQNARLQARLEDVREQVTSLEMQRVDLRRHAASTGAERDQLKAALAGLKEVFESAGNALAGAPDDWSQTRGKAWMWGLFCGWDCEKVHEHDPDNDPTCIWALDETAAKHGWSPELVARLRQLRSAVAALDQPEES